MRVIEFFICITLAQANTDAMTKFTATINPQDWSRFRSFLNEFQEHDVCTNISCCRSTEKFVCSWDYENNICECFGYSWVRNGISDYNATTGRFTSTIIWHGRKFFEEHKNAWRSPIHQKIIKSFGINLDSINVTHHIRP